MATEEPKRFRDLMQRSKRNRDASRVAVSILRADSKVALEIERELAEVDLTLPQFNVLMVLAASPEGALPMFELNAQLTTSAPNMSWLSTRMQEQRLVRKTRGREDGRVVMMELTERGWGVLAEAAPLVFAVEKELFSGYSRSELRTLAELLGRLLRD